MITHLPIACTLSADELRARLADPLALHLRRRNRGGSC
jgi:hypothetical protein